MVGDPSGDQAADQIARDIAGDVSGERAAGVHGAALLAQIGEHEGEGGRHAQSLRDPQRREDGQVGRDRQQRRRDRQQCQAHQDAQAAIDALRKQGNRETGHRHTHCAGIDREAHGRRRHIVGAGERRQDRLRREQVDHREKGRQSDHDRAQQHSGGVAVHVHRRRIHDGCSLRHDDSFDSEEEGLTPRSGFEHRGVTNGLSDANTSSPGVVTCCGRPCRGGRRRRRARRSCCRGSATSAMCRWSPAGSRRPGARSARSSCWRIRRSRPRRYR